MVEQNGVKQHQLESDQVQLKIKSTPEDKDTGLEILVRVYELVKNTIATARDVIDFFKNVFKNRKI